MLLLREVVLGPIAIAFFLGPLAPTANAQEESEVCSRASVRSIGLSYDDLDQKTLLDKVAEIIEPSESRVSRNTYIEIAARGPILDFMDSQQLKIRLICTATGFTITGIISRSEYYTGSIPRSQHWQPRIKMVVMLRASEVVVHVRWEMRLTNGKEVNRARTPPYPERHYPITVTKILREAPGQKR
jgi:hypothetical protein